MSQKSLFFTFLGYKRSRNIVVQWFPHQGLTWLFTYGDLKDYICKGFKSNFMASMIFNSCPYSLKCWKEVRWSREDRWCMERKEHTEQSYCKTQMPLKNPETFRGTAWIFAGIFNVQKEVQSLVSLHWLWTKCIFSICISILSTRCSFICFQNGILVIHLAIAKTARIKKDFFWIYFLGWLENSHANVTRIVFYLKVKVKGNLLCGDSQAGLQFHIVFEKY